MESLEEDDDFIITSRLDNDDSIHHDFVYIIQNLAIKKHETIIDLRRGYQLDISSNIYEYRNYYNKFNPFISLVESTSNFQTVFLECIMNGKCNFSYCKLKFAFMD